MKLRESQITETARSNSVEQSANYEGNDTLLFYNRLNNPEIKRQLINTLCEYQETIDRPSQIFSFDAQGKMFEVPVSEWKPEIHTREEIEAKLDSRIQRMILATELDYDPKSLSRKGDDGFGIVAFCSTNPNNNSPWTIKQLSITEAHEKGHEVRLLPEIGRSLSTKIQSCLDKSKIVITDQMMEFWNSKLKEQNKEITDQDTSARIVEYFLNPDEIIERMSQLKNYFGMSGSEVFTKEHLDYAKQHYLEDTGFGFQIKPFLDAITPETEDVFLELINTLGI